jgi:hypothetical protein
MARTKLPKTTGLPVEVTGFRPRKRKNPDGLTRDEWLAGSRNIEVKDKNQLIWLRPIFAGAVYLLLLAQNVAIFMIVIKALDANVLNNLQLIFSTLVAGTLTQSYLILRLIAEKVFGEIVYDNNRE